MSKSLTSADLKKLENMASQLNTVVSHATATSIAAAKNKRRRSKKFTGTKKTTKKRSTRRK